MEQVSPSAQGPYLPPHRYPGPRAHRPAPEDVFITPYGQLSGAVLGGVEGIIEPTVGWMKTAIRATKVMLIAWPMIETEE